MNPQQKLYFSALSEKRAVSAGVLLEDVALSGVWESVIGKYSDQAHFVYELLQNADDAKATSARFELFPDKLIFAHNGTKHFSVSDPDTEKQDRKANKLGDINAITAIGASNKIKEATIGKFGLGFKAVFQYTATPHIYDPSLFFKIDRLLVPKLLDKDHPRRQEGETLFVFPFDHDSCDFELPFSRCSAEIAYADIAEKLTSLDYPLLFLTNLRSISFETPDMKGGSGKDPLETRQYGDTVAERIRLTQNTGTECVNLCDDTLWLFSRTDDANHWYAVGYFIDQNEKLIRKKHTAFCFFPTKEMTNLDFIFHAPFLLTDSRETIKAGEEHNLHMVSLLADLAADSLEYLLDIGQSRNNPLITDDIFDIVPFDESRFEEASSKKNISFMPFYTAMKKAFASRPIIPALGGYTSTNHAYWAFVPQIAELFSNEQLAAITGDPAARWVFPSFGRQDTQRKNKPLTEYIDSITAVWLDESDILGGWSYDDGTEQEGITGAFIETQRPEWLHRFYKWLSETDGRKRLVRTSPIFLNQNGKAAAAFDEKQQAILFLPAEDGSGYDTIHEDLLQNEATVTFLKGFGIKEPSLKSEIYLHILPQYKDGIPLNTRPHFKKFFAYYQICQRSDVKGFLDLIRKCEFVLYRSADDETQYRGRADELYFPTESLCAWFETKPNTKFVSYEEYVDLVGKEAEEDLVEFLTALGVKNVPCLLTYQLSEQEAYKLQREWPHGRDKEWSETRLDGCAEIIKMAVDEQSAEKSETIWKELLELVKAGILKKDSWAWAQNDILRGKYRYFYYSQHCSSFESNTAKWLRTLPWLLNREGKFVSASELTVQTLAPQYDKSSDEVLELFAILGISDTVEDSGEDWNDLTSYAQSLGLSDEEQRLALLEFANRKKSERPDEPNGEKYPHKDNEDDEDEEPNEDMPSHRASIKRVARELSRRAGTPSTPSTAQQKLPAENDPLDEDDYTKTVNVERKIENIKERAEREIQEIARMEDLQRQAEDAEVYSYGWFKALMELEALSSGENNSDSHEISIVFSAVEWEIGTSRTLILKHPNRYIPQFMEDLADIPLQLHFADRSAVKVAIEVISVKSYTLRVKLRTNANLDGIDLSLVTEARIEARNPVFLMEELRWAFVRFGEQNGYADDYNMRDNLCENIEFVFGPPGTGKTTHLAKDIILPLMQSPEELKVLVLTPTNKAADVLTRRIIDVMGENRDWQNWLVRFGATSDSIIESCGVFRDKTFDIRTFPRNVTVTTIARFPYDYFLPDETTRLHLYALKWDYILIDEASMIPLANIIYPLYKKTPKKFIIAGDPFQIEPITMVDLWRDENIYRMVELNSFTEPTTRPHAYPVELLTTQYRSIPDIGEVFSRFAYGGVLKHFRASDSRRLLPLAGEVQSLNIIKFPVSRFESIYRPKRLQKKTPYQIYSALFSLEFVKHLSLFLAQDRNYNYQIGLIAPYRAQADLIDKLLLSVELPKNVDVQVGTIHGFQGDECDIVIALFNPPPSITSSKKMFLNKLNIINVSISRARDYLFILMPDDNTENADGLTLIKEIEQLCKQQRSWNEQHASAVEQIMFGSETYIEDHSFATSHQLVNVYGKPEKRYEVRSEDGAVDVQIHESTP